MSELYTRITNDIIAAIEAGAKGSGPLWNRLADAHRNVDGRPYRGINAMLLAASALRAGYAQPVWATLRAWNAVKANVRKGERGTTVILWKKTQRRVEEDEADEKLRSSVYARAFTVFNISQVDNAPEVDAARPAALTRFETHGAVQAALDGLGVQDMEQGGRAFYAPSIDAIVMPPRTAFRDEASFHAVLLHEMTHATGAQHRLKRDLRGRFGSASYAMEELVAEIGAAFTTAAFGVPQLTREDHASYVASWLQVLKEDRKAIVTCAAAAQRAADYLIELARGEEPSQTEEPEAVAAE